MKKLFLAALILLQSYVYAGPVCGNHVSTVESMACCEEGHQEETSSSVGDSHASTCCSMCDMGKASGLEKRQENTDIVSVMPLARLATDPPAIRIEADHPEWDNQTFASYSPPLLFVLNASFRN